MGKYFRAPLHFIFRHLRRRASSDEISQTQVETPASEDRASHASKDKGKGKTIPKSVSSPPGITVEETFSVSSEAGPSNSTRSGSASSADNALEATPSSRPLESEGSGGATKDRPRLKIVIPGAKISIPNHLGADYIPPQPAPAIRRPPPRNEQTRVTESRSSNPAISDSDGQQQRVDALPEYTPDCLVTMDLSLPQAWSIPGFEHYWPLSTHPAGGLWLCDAWATIIVQGYPFRVPVALLSEYEGWTKIRQGLNNLDNPIQAWHISDVHPTVFGFVMDGLMAPQGFQGTEPGLNLVILLEAAEQCETWGMRQETNKLLMSAYRYIARRIFFRNPFDSRSMRDVDHNYHTYRSEEIYRSWKILDSSKSYVGQQLTAEEVAMFYVFAIPQDVWPATTADFSDRFNELVDLSASAVEDTLKQEFEKWWFRYIVKSGLLDYSWLQHSPTAMNLLVDHLELLGRS